MFGVPESLPPHEAAALSVVACTAADALYGLTKVPPPDADGPQGGRSRTGIGVGWVNGRWALPRPICPGEWRVATAAPSRHELLRDLGATHCFDYKDPDVTSKIKSAVRESGAGKLSFAIDAAGSGEAVELIEQLAESGTVFLSTVVHLGKPHLRMPLACTRHDVPLRLANGMEITVPARFEDWKKTWGAVNWAVAHYGKGFRMPAVEVFDGSAEDALVELQKIAVQGNFWQTGN